MFLGCHVTNECKCDLKLSGLESESETNLVLGKDDILNIKFKLSNDGEDPAFGTQIHFPLPLDLPIIGSDKVQCSSRFIDVS